MVYQLFICFLAASIKSLFITHQTCKSSSQLSYGKVYVDSTSCIDNASVPAVMQYHVLTFGHCYDMLSIDLHIRRYTG